MNKGHSFSAKNGKILVFKIIAVLLPFAFILLLEGCLRVFGYGHDLRLFVEEKGNPDYLVMNSYASERYFTNRDNATIGVFEPFRKKKPQGTFRIFVLGESTTLGFPFMASASFDRWLYYRLMHTFPEREFEIVNISLTAVNSYTVLGFAREIVKYEPDAVMIYCGQNEYYGALGVGSSSQLGGNRILIQSLLYLRSFRTIQLLENLYSGARNAITSHPNDTHETLMQRMAAHQEIPYHSTMYQRGIRQFERNMQDVCSFLSEKGIPVLISNLVSNEKDQKPFISSKGNIDFSADYHYALGQKAYDQSDFVTARHQFIQAKDLDMLRFRAPDTLNTLIEDLPHRYKGVYLVDTKRIFENYSPHGIIGKETMMEHVHPDILGYGLMSDAFYKCMKQSGLIHPEKGSEISLEQLLRSMPITMVDSLKGDIEIRLLKEKWPFNQPKTVDVNNMRTFEEKLAVTLLYQKITWVNAMKTQLDYYLRNHDQKNMLKVAEASVLQIVNNADYLFYTGKLCSEQHQTERAKVYFQHAFHFLNTQETAQRLVILFMKDDQPEKALPYLSYLEQNSPSQTIYRNTSLLAKEIIGYKYRLQAEGTNAGLLNMIALDYYKMHNIWIANQYIDRSYLLDNKNSETVSLREKIKAMPTQN